MSSILDALKKLERENAGEHSDTGQGDDPGFSWPVPVDSKESHSKRLKKKFGIAPLIGVFILTFVVGCGVLVFWDLLKTDKNEKKMESAPMEPLMEKAPSAVLPFSSTNDPTASTRPGMTGNPAATGGPASSPDQYRHVSERELPGKGDESSDDTYGTDKVSSGKEQPTEVISPTLDKESTEIIAKIPKDMLPPKKIADSKWLTLQGVSWSKNPQYRVAVINSQILKEGRRVDGALIMRIDKDYVVVEKDGEQYMVPFNHH